jgi:Heparan-alpha-glucosaminide N-acetyltransferase, catalytic
LRRATAESTPRAEPRHARGGVSATEGDVSHVAGAAPRALFLDVLRCVAAFQMIQGHTIAATLAPEHRSGALHAVWFAARGLTSVMFLFAAGFAFHWTTARVFAARHRDASLFLRRARRAALLVLIGYALRAPLALWTSADSVAHEAALRGFFAVDVLHCIGVTLLCLQALVWLAPSAAVFGAWVAWAGLLVVVFTPVATQLEPRGAWVALGAYVSPRAGSLFPIFPWAAHMFFGAACSAWLLRPGRMSAQLRLSQAALASFAGFGVLHAAGAAALLAEHAGRLACVVALAALLAWALARRRTLPRVVSDFASDTLFLYGFHVLLVYGAGGGLADSIGPRLGPLAAIGCAVAMLLLCGGLSLWRMRRA